MVLSSKFTQMNCMSRAVLNVTYSKIFPQQPAEALHATVRAYLLEQLSGLDPTSVLVIRKLIRAGLRDKNDFDAVNLRETYEQARRFASGKPQERFAMVARKEIKHKL